MARILVVDDEPDILLLLRFNLETAGHEVLLAADGMKALERIEADRPDAVLLDVMMPVLDGWGVLEKLRDHPDHPPVLVVTAYPSPANEERARALGAAGFVKKPFETE